MGPQPCMMMMNFPFPGLGRSERHNEKLDDERVVAFAVANLLFFSSEVWCCPGAHHGLSLSIVPLCVSGFLVRAGDAACSSKRLRDSESPSVRAWGRPDTNLYCRKADSI